MKSRIIVPRKEIKYYLDSFSALYRIKRGKVHYWDNVFEQWASSRCSIYLVSQWKSISIEDLIKNPPHAHIKL